MGIRSRKPRLEKYRYHFSSAYEREFKKKWDWSQKDSSGNQIHPALSEDLAVVYFYRGYRAASISSKEWRSIIGELERLEKEIERLKKLI